MGIMSRTGSRMAMRFCSGALGTRRRESRRSTRSTATTELRLSRNPPVFQPLSPERATGIVEAEGLLPSGGSSVVSISQLFLALAFVFPHSMQRVSRKRSDPESEGNREAQRITRSSHQRFSLCCLLDARANRSFFYGNEDATFYNRALCYVCQGANAEGAPLCISFIVSMSRRGLRVLQEEGVCELSLRV